MSKRDELMQEIELIDNRINTYKHYLYLRNTGQIAITDRTTEIDLPRLEMQALETYDKLLLFHWSLEYKKEQEEKNE